MPKVALTRTWAVYLLLWASVWGAVGAIEAQVADGSPAGSSKTISLQPSQSPRSSLRTTSQQKKLRKKYDITKIGQRNVGAGVNFYSLEREAQLGKELADQVEASVRLYSDSLVVEYVSNLAQKLGMHSDAKIPLNLKVLHDSQVNAFALPGGYLYVTTGLILFCDDEAELAGAMAHEIAHVAARHGTRTLTKSQLWSFASIPLSMVGGPAGAAVSSLASVAGPLAFLKLGRNEELEADLLGLEYLYLAGYDPQELIRFFEKTASTTDTRANFFSKAFATHPQAEDRIRRAQSGAQILLPPREEYVVDTSYFQEVKNSLASSIPRTSRDDEPILLNSSSEDKAEPPDEPDESSLN